MNEFTNLIPAIFNPVKIESFHYPGINNKYIGKIWYPVTTGSKTFTNTPGSETNKSINQFPLLVFDLGLQYRVWDMPLAAEMMARLGFVVLGIEYTDKEILKGEVKEFTVAIDLVRRTYPFIARETVLVGISLGAVVMLNLASRYERKFNILGVVAIAPYADLTTEYYYARGYDISRQENDPRAKLLRLYLKQTKSTQPSMFTDTTHSSPLQYINKIRAPLLLIHGEKDAVVSVSHSIELYHKMAKLDKKVNLKIVPGEGIHTPLDLVSMLNNFNLIGFTQTWLHVYQFLRNISNHLNPK